MAASRERYGAIVIGAGLGGLAAAARLARAGVPVLVIERHTAVGGFATTFRRGDYTFEVSLHELDAPYYGAVKRQMFEQLGVYDGVEFVKIPEFFRYRKGDVDLTVPHDAKGAIEAYAAQWPAERKGIRRFFNAVMGIAREVNRLPLSPLGMALALPVFPLLYPRLMFNQRTTVADMLRHVRDEDLKMALMANLGYYHNDPATASALYYGVAQGSYLEGGGYYIKGGSQKLSDHLARVVAENGGEVATRHQAIRLIVENGRATGIEYARVSGEKGVVHTARAPVVVANAAVPLVVNNMAPEAFDPEYRARVKALETGPSITSVYLGLRTSLRELGNRAYVTITVDPRVTSLAELASPGHELFEREFSFADYSQIDSGLAPAGKGVVSVAALDRLERWEGLSSDEYRARKERVAARAIERLEALVPGAARAVEVVEVGTPKTIMRFTANPGGAIYGFAQTPGQAGRFRLPVRSPLPGLYFASAWAMPGGGFTGALMSGWFASQEILRREKSYLARAAK
ncbi:MAG: NAD(P)/FAD-dependent oxidoreductase [Nitrospinae bacterium]|nr:NAD(P)/FAD-dependent oxidoreductase [Nitrospinota bacterium]